MSSVSGHKIITCSFDYEYLHTQPFGMAIPGIKETSMIRSISKLLVLVLICSSYQAICQNEKGTYVPPSPEASALLKYASVPVNLYAGLIDVSIPLFTLKSRNTEVPVSVSYHGGGIKVQDISSAVGLGFALNAGGAITRIVRGLPDEDPQGYLNQNFNTVFGNTSTYDDIAGGNLDAEPDIFYYNFLGFTGRVVLDPNKSPIQLPEMDLKIVPPDFAATNPTWRITDKQGVIYTFGAESNSRESTTSSLNTTSKVTTYISSWYLSSISSVNSTDVVTFTYQPGSNVAYENYRQFQSVRINTLTGCSMPGWPEAETSTPFNIVTTITTQAPKYISIITSTLGTASFSYAFDRQDISGALRLTEAKMVNRAGTEITKYAFDNSTYFVSDGCSTSDCKRLKLSQIREVTNGVNLTKNTFGYFTTNLPSRSSIKYDHWGYYNNNTYTSAIGPSKSYNVFGTPTTYPGADKTPNLANAQANALKTIGNAAGGTQEFVYQLNEYEDSGIKTTGGLRIYQIVENDGTGINPSVTRTFRYRQSANTGKSSGKIYRKYYYDYARFNRQQCSSPPGASNSYQMVMRYSTSLVDFFDIGGLHVGYAEAQIEYPNGAKEQLYFTSFADRADDPATYQAPPGMTSPDYTDVDGPPFISFGDRSYERGLVKEHIWFNTDGRKLKRIVNHYDYYLVSSAEAPGGKIMLLDVNINAKSYRNGKYILKNYGVRLADSRTTMYDQNDDSKYISSKVIYAYNSIYSTLVKSEQTLLNNGDVILREYKYPKDYPNFTVTVSDVESDGVYHLGSRHIISRVIEDVTSVKRSSWTEFKVIKASLTTYKRDLSNQIVSPKTDYYLPLNAPAVSFQPSSVTSNGSAKSFNKDPNYKVATTYDTYNSDGSLTQYTSQDGISTQLQWVENGSLIGAIVTDPSGVPRTSTYEQLPLIGIASITDPALRKSYYTYDKMNRLKLIKDHDSNIESRIRYAYKSQPEMTGADFTNAGNTATQAVTFTSLLNTETAGSNSYVWDFGNGQVVDNAGPSVTHYYASPGTYTVKMAKVNQEYGSQMISKSVVIYAPVGVNISGVPTSFNRCTSASATFSATATGGCGPYTFVWRIRAQGTTSWQVLGSGSAVSFYSPYYSTGNYEVQCEASDSCSHTGASVSTFQIYCM